MSTSIGRAVLEIATDLSNFTTKDASKQLSELTGLSRESMTALAQGAGLAFGAVTVLAGGIVALGLRGSELAGVKDSFDSLTRGVGQSGDEMLAMTKGATKGLIKDLDIMAATNKGLLLGLPLTGESMSELSRSAIVLGRAMKQDATKSLDDLIVALGRSSPMILDNLGLSVKVGEANEKYARSIGKTAEELTDAEKKTAFYNATVEAARAKVGELGDIQLTMADRVTIASNMVGNFTDALSIAIAQSPVLAAGMDAITGGMESAFGGDQQALVQKLNGYVSDFAIGVTYGADTLIFFGQRGNEVMTMLKVVIAGVGTGVTYLAEKIASSLEGILSVGEKIPGLGEKFTPARQAMAETRAVLNGMRVDYQAQVAEAIDGGAKNAASLSAWSGAIQATRAAMIAAKNTQIELNAATDAGTEANKAAVPAINERLAAEMASFQARKEQHLDLLRVSQFSDDEGIASYQRAIEAKAELDRQYRNLQNEIGLQRMEADAAMNQSIGDRAAALGFRTRAELEQTAEIARLTYADMQESGEFTAAELEKAWAAYETARLAANDASGTSWVSTNEALLNSTVSILGQLGTKYKAAAIAGAIISTYQAIAKSMASLPWPANLISAAGAAAAGWANVAKIRASEAGFRVGTPNLDFMRFNPLGEPITVHDDEAIIPRGGGHQLAGEIASSLDGGGAGMGDAGAWDGLRKELIGLRRDGAIRDRLLPGMLATATRDAMQKVMA